MEGDASTFKKVLADFESRLHGAEFVAIDTELTGVDIEGEPDSFDESAQQRLEKHCRIAERYTLIQLGLTVVSRLGTEGHWSCSSYNLFAFPYVGPELPGREPGFYCQASALRFNSQHRVNFNRWIGDGIPYMSREDEKRYISAGHDSEEKAGLLKLWKVLCAARLPFVVHCPLDLFFLLAAFERRPLPRNNPKALAMMIRQCTPKVYDTAHIHGVLGLGRFKRLGLMKFFEDAKAEYEELASSSGVRVPPVTFELQPETAARYSQQDDGLAHEAGYDSLVTAQLFAYLRAIAPAQVKEAGNRLFLFKSIEFLDLDRAALEGQVGVSMFDLNRVTLLVAELEPAEGSEAPRLIAAAGALYKWVDNSHVLVVIRASGGAAVRRARELASKVRGVVSWQGFDEWRDAQATVHRSEPSRPLKDPYTNGTGGQEKDERVNGTDHEASLGFWTSLLWLWRLRKQNLSVGLLGAGSGIILLLLAQNRGRVLEAAFRLYRRWRWR